MKIILSWHLAKGLRRQLGVWRGWIVPQLQKIGLWLIPHMQLQHQYMEYYYLPHHSFHSSRVSNQRDIFRALLFTTILHTLSSL